MKVLPTIGLGAWLAAHVAYWEGVLAKVVETAEWKKTLESNNGSASFLRSREFARFLDVEYDETRGVMTDLGLVK